jgi:hypothetical protein
MQWTNLVALVMKHCELPVANHGYPGQPRARIVDPHAPAELVDAESSTWENAWIDLGGEG